MKRIGIAFIMVMAMIFTVTAGNNNEGRLKFEKTTYDFGNIKEDGGPVSCEFEFENTGKTAVEISRAFAECGCTRPEYPKGSIAPGEKGVIKVTYNPLGRPGGFTKVVTVRNTGNPGKINLKIRGTVLPK